MKMNMSIKDPAGVIPTRVLGLPQSIETDQRPDKRFRQGFIGTPDAQGGSENK